MKKILASVLIALIAVTSLSALPLSLEFGMSELEIMRTYPDYEKSKALDFDSVSSYLFDPDEAKARTWSEVKAFTEGENGILVISEKEGCPEKSYQRRYDAKVREIEREYGPALDMERFMLDHPFNEDVLFLVLLGGISDEKLVEDTLLGLVDMMAKEEGIEGLKVFRTEEHSVALLVPTSSTEMITWYVSPDAIRAFSLMIRNDVSENIAKRFGDFMN